MRSGKMKWFLKLAGVFGFFIVIFSVNPRPFSGEWWGVMIGAGVIALANYIEGLIDGLIDG